MEYFVTAASTVTIALLTWIVREIIKFGRWQSGQEERIKSAVYKSESARDSARQSLEAVNRHENRLEKMRSKIDSLDGKLDSGFECITNKLQEINLRCIAHLKGDDKP